MCILLLVCASFSSINIVLIPTWQFFYLLNTSLLPLIYTQVLSLYPCVPLSASPCAISIFQFVHHAVNIGYTVLSFSFTHLCICIVLFTCYCVSTTLVFLPVLLFSFAFIPYCYVLFVLFMHHRSVCVLILSVVVHPTPLSTMCNSLFIFFLPNMVFLFYSVSLVLFSIYSLVCGIYHNLLPSQYMVIIVDIFSIFSSVLLVFFYLVSFCSLICSFVFTSLLYLLHMLV